MSIMAYCGLLCDECPVYVATLRQDDRARARLAEEYSNEKMQFTFEDIYCESCFSSANDASKLCQGCGMRACAKPRNVKNCGCCEEYPCATIERYLPPNSEYRLRLDAVARELQV